MNCDHDLQQTGNENHSLPEEQGVICSKCEFEWWAWWNVDLKEALKIWDEQITNKSATLEIE